MVVAASGWDVEGEPCSPVWMLARWLVGSGCGTFACVAWPRFHVRKMNLDPVGRCRARGGSGSLSGSVFPCVSPTDVFPVSPGADCPAEGQPGNGQRQPISQALRQLSRRLRCRFRRTRWRPSRAACTSDPNIGAGLKHDKQTIFKNSTQAEPYKAPWMVTWCCGPWPTTASPAWCKNRAVADSLPFLQQS